MSGAASPSRGMRGLAWPSRGPGQAQAWPAGPRAWAQFSFDLGGGSRGVGAGRGGAAAAGASRERPLADRHLGLPARGPPGLGFSGGHIRALIR